MEPISRFTQPWIVKKLSPDSLGARPRQTSASVRIITMKLSVSTMPGTKPAM